MSGVRWVGDATRGGEALAPVAAVEWRGGGVQARVDAEGALVVVDAAWRPDDGDEHGASVASAALARWCSQRGAVLRGMRREGGCSCDGAEGGHRLHCGKVLGGE